MVLKSNQGFTLLEVMISLAILGITSTVLLGLRNWDLDARIFSQKVTIAT
ncbi:MAG TPA: prepilin-type N-terminal cleavage/methylation domain-containing protein, partial [Nitrospirales bacterium]|nr:prepilin-type N-terminal cleavage/methylation domain-containing protein [Nitrospirales bacterium]